MACALSSKGAFLGCRGVLLSVAREGFLAIVACFSPTPVRAHRRHERQSRESFWLSWRACVGGEQGKYGMVEPSSVAALGLSRNSLEPKAEPTNHPEGGMVLGRRCDP